MAKEIQIKLSVDDSQLQNAAGSADNLRKQLREASIDLENTVNKFGLTSAEAAKAAQKVGELRDTLGDARALANAFDADKKFAAVGQALQGVLGGFQAVQGAMAAFGVENEDVQKSLLKIQGLMAFTQGINQVLAAKDSFKNLGVVIQTTTGIQKIFTATTTATSTALNAVGVSSTAASVGVRAFSSALIATGIGALVVGLGLAVNAFIDFIDNTAEATAANEAFNRSLKLTDVGLKGELAFIKRSGAERLAEAKAQGKSQADLTKLTNENIDSEIKALQRAQNERTNVYNKALKDKNLQAKDFQKISDDYVNGEIETTTRIKDLQSQQKINNYQVQEQIQKDNQAAGKKKQADAAQFHKKQIDAQKEAADMINKVTREANQALFTEDQLKLAQIQNQRDDDLAKLKTNLDAKLITQKQFNDAKAALDLRAANQTTAAQAEIDKKNKEKEDDKQKKDLEDFIKKSKEKLDLALMGIDNDEAAKQRKLDEKRAAKQITDFEYETQSTQLAYDAATQRETAVNTVIEQGGQYKAQLQTEFAQQSNQLAQNTADTQTGIAVTASEQQIAIEKAKTDALKEMQDLTIGNIAAFGNLLSMFGEQSKGLAIAAIVIEQGSNIAKIVMDTQREIAGYYAAYSAIPVVGPGIASGLAVGAKIRAGIGIATSVAAAALGISKIKSANKNSSGGGGGVPSLGASGGGGGAAAAMAAPNAPTLSAATTPTIGLSTANPNMALQQSIAGAQQRPVQAYVVSTAVTSQQALDRRRRGNGVQNSSDQPVQTALSTGG
jgi:hypothetical protein